MPELSLGLSLSAFIAGMIMFLAPCTLPLVPAYLAFVSGIPNGTLRDPLWRANAKREILKNSVAYVIGFSAVFIFFGIVLGYLGSYVGEYRSLLARLGGLFIIGFGLVMLGVLNLPGGEKKIAMPSALTPGKTESAFLMGAIFALGWTPCVGPILASVLLLASTSETAIEGGILLSIFSIGHAVPFVLVALFYAEASRIIERFAYVSTYVSVLGGLFLIWIGFLLLTDNFALIIDYGFRIFEFLEYDAILRYL